MFTSVWGPIALGVFAVGLFVYSLFKHEQRLEEMERKIVAHQEKFTNK